MSEEAKKPTAPSAQVEEQLATGHLPEDAGIPSTPIRWREDEKLRKQIAEEQANEGAQR